MSLIGELKRRSVFKVGAAYLVVGWLVIQAASIMFPLFEAPPWALRVFVLCVFLGFPVALVLAWVFDVTPDGIIKTDGARAGSWKFYSMAAAVMALSLGWYFYGQPATREVAPDQRSIAVLPFVNMSGDAENEYFSDGISEEILNQLAKMPELRVAARTSSFAFKGQKLEIPAIAKELKVHMVLEGSVRKQGDKVRITAQLIDAQEGFHLWSETYDRDLKDIFAIQDEISRAIAKQLQLKLGATGAAGPGALATASDDGDKAVDVEAYDLYLRALGLLPHRDYHEMAQAMDLLERSVARAPTFARAQATLAIAYILYGQYAPDAPVLELLDKATTAAHRALAADPLSAEAFGALGLVAVNRGLGDDATAQVLFERSIALNPSFASAHTWLALSLRTAGKWKEAERENRISLELDPRSLNIYTNLSWHLAAEGRYDEAEALLQRKLELAPDSPTVLAEVATMYLHAKRYADARAHLARGIKEDPESQRLFSDLFDALEGRKPKAEVAARIEVGFADSLRPEVNNYVRPNVVLISLLALDAREEALKFVERSVAEMEARPGGRGILRIVLASSAVGDLRCEPRFQAALARIRVVDGLAVTMCKQ